LTWKLYHNKNTSRGTKSNKFYWKWEMDEGDTRPWSCSPKMQFGELKLKLWISIGFRKINTSWIDLKIFPYKLEGRTQLFQQVLLNLDLECKIYNTLNWTWTWNSMRTLSILFVTLGLILKCPSEHFVSFGQFKDVNRVEENIFISKLFWRIAWIQFEWEVWDFSS